MELLKLLLGILIFISVKDAAGNYSDDYWNSHDWEVYCRRDTSIELLGYDVELKTYINTDDYKHTNIYKKFKSYIDEQRARGNFIFYGESALKFQCTNQTSKICLHANNLEIDEAAIKLTHFRDDDNNVTYVPRKHTYDRKTQIIVLYFDEVLNPDSNNYHLIMKFVGSITDNSTEGFVKTSYLKNKGEKTWFIAAADFRGIGARQIFPCEDEPDLRTTFTISIKHHKNYTAISNSPVNYIAKNENDMVTTHFDTTENISPYHIAIVLSDDLDRISNNKNVWCRKIVESHIVFAQKVAENATSYLKDLLLYGEFPSKVDHVIVPSFRDEGLESWGLVLYREAAVIYNEKLDSIAWKFEVARMVARKVVHQFFGNLVSQSWWSYLWLNEGIASVMAMRIVQRYIHSHLADLLAVQFQHESLRLNDHYDMPLVSKVITPEDINSLFSFTYYVKAFAFVREVEQTVGRSSFEINLDDYMVEYQLKSIDISDNTADMFFDLLQRTLLPFNKKYITLKKRLSQLAKQERYPIVEVTRESSGDMIKIKLSQEYVNKTYGQNLWTRVTYDVQSSLNHEQEKWLSPHNPNFHLTDIKKSDWIIVNVEQAGYYRVYYDYDIWEKLMKYLNSEEYLKIHVLNRAQIIDDAYYFLLRNKLNDQFFKNLTYYLSRETNYVAWYPMFKIMEEISSSFPFPETTEVKEHFRNILDIILRKIGYAFVGKMPREEDDFIKCLRQEAAKWACILNSQQCTNMAFFELRRHNHRPSTQGWREWRYCNGLMTADSNYWNHVLNTELLDNSLLESLACTKDYDIIISYIDLLKSGYFIQAQHRITVFHSIIARHAKNYLVLDYILKNFTNIVPREIDTFVALTDIINHLYFQDQLSKAYNYARDNFSDKMFQHVVRKLNRREGEIGVIIKYFKSFIKK